MPYLKYNERIYETFGYIQPQPWTGLLSIVTRDQIKNQLAVLHSFQVYKKKWHPSGLIKKFEARFYARGDLQQHGLNCWETYSPVVQWSFVRFYLIFVHKCNLLTHQCDYSNSYYQSPLDEELYMEIPPSLCCDVRTKPFSLQARTKSRNKYVLKLNMSMYGLRQAGINWFSLLTNLLLENGLTQSYDYSTATKSSFLSTSMTPFSSPKTNLRLYPFISKTNLPSH